MRQQDSMLLVSLLVFAGVAAGGYAAGSNSLLDSFLKPSTERAIAIREYHQGDMKDAFNEFQRLAKKGDNSAAFYLGQMYEFGHGTAVNGDEAVKWLRKSAGAGNAIAARQLGELYYNGTVVVQDFGKAETWLKQAAQAGDETAMINLGHMASNGFGMAANPVTAYAYYAAASAKGSNYAETLRNKIAAKLSVDQQASGEQQAKSILADVAKSPATNGKSKDSVPSS
nr:tetratricopeptide repeat protein [uncultured Cohaesibacter sp.]